MLKSFILIRSVCTILLIIVLYFTYFITLRIIEFRLVWIVSTPF